ncbi:MAG: beta-N-acetylglucosaminidase domain-containing protein [Armatimonadetes bacterium]|nr:beta-N-acetylglucosaminidase domain-containing protein [Armatimonadota bacterium]
MVALVLILATATAHSGGSGTIEPQKPSDAILPSVQAPSPKQNTGFKLRGSKGWGWSRDQYLTEIPWMAKAKMNFVMNCYLSYYTDRLRYVNNWWEPKSEAEREDWRKVVQRAKERGLHFVFAFHPQLHSSRPYDYHRQGDYQALWRHFEFMQGLGVRWYSLSLDDIGTEGTQPAQLAQLQSDLVNRLLTDLRKKDSGAQMIFCPTYYWGDGTEKEFQPYWSAMAKALDRNAYVFWTGPQVVSQTVDLASAKRIRKAMGHRVVLWDNYPVNDRNPALHLGPVSGRDPRLPEVLDGYMTNPMGFQNELNRLPMLTCGDYAYDPGSYDPARSLDRAIDLLSDKPEQADLLRRLVEVYPGCLAAKHPETGWQTQWASYVQAAGGPQGRVKGAMYLQRMEQLEADLIRWFPGAMASEKELLANHVAAIRAEQAKRFP